MSETNIENEMQEGKGEQGPFSTPERAKRTKMMMLIGASVCIVILMLIVQIPG